jgi:hypothetical protein
MQINQGDFMKLVGKNLFALAFLAGALSAQAQVRTWAFSKDTLFDWASSGDFVDVSNTGTDTLQFDSVALQLISPSMNTYEVLFHLQTGTPALCHFRYDQGVVIWPGCKTQKIKVAAGQTRRLVNFEAESHIPATAKRAAIGDTLVIRMIFIAGANRGRDTLMLRGRQEYPSSIRTGEALRNGLFGETRFFDLRGRRMENLPKGLKALEVSTPTRE